MALGLGNNLIRNGGASNPDKLSLDLQFAADKTLTARKGPTPTFLRASAATQVNAAGLIEWAPENLYLYSQNFADSFWTKTRSSVQANVAIAPDGTLTATKLIEDTTPTNGHTLSSATTPTAIPHRLSIFAKKGERNWIVLRLGGSNDFFNLDTGVATTNINSPTITDVGNGWYRCSVLSSAGTQGSFQMSADGTTTVYTGDGTSGIFLWGAQLERSSTARAYIPTTTAAVYGARFDHDPVTLACKGLLIEEQRINQILQSENLGTTWTQTNVSASLNVAVAPDGKTTADKIVENTASAIHGVDQQTTFTAVPYTLSFYAKKDGRTWIRAFFSGLASTWFNIDSGTVGTVASGFTASIVDAGNGWYRCSISGTAAAGTLSSGVRMATGDGINTYLGDGVSGVFVWGAQLEAGAFPTSYIPTTTGPVTRSADVCSITGAAFTGFYNNAQGTLVTNASALGFGVSQNPVISIENGTTQVMRLRYVATTNRLSAIVSAVALSPSSNYDVANTFYKAALSAGATSADFVINGTQIPDTYTGSVLTADNMKLSSVSVGISNIHLASVRYYKKQLPVTRLQDLTV